MPRFPTALPTRLVPMSEAAPLPDPKDHVAISGSLAEATAHLKAGDLQSATDIAERLSRLKPTPGAVHRLASRLAAAREDAPEALRRLELALEAQGGRTAQDLVDLAQYAWTAGRLEAALDILADVPATSDARTRAAAIFLQTRCLARLGRIPEARDAIRELTRLEGRGLRSQWLIADVNASAGDHEGARDRYAAILKDPRVPPPIRLSVAFGLARACDRLGDAPNAWKAAELGNRLLNARFDAASHARETDAIIESVTPSWFDSLARGSNEDARPVFVVGLPRSGTSLVEQIIASHPRGAGVGERGDPIHAAARLVHRTGTPFPGCLEKATTADLDEIADRYIAMLDGAGFDADRIVNKALGLERVLPLVAAAMPACRIVFVERNPRDQILSSYLHQLRGTGLRWATRLEDLVAARRAFDRLADHLPDVLPVPVHRLRYEDLVADQARTTEDLLAFLGLDPDPACLAFHEHRRAVMTPSFDQVNKPLDDAAVDRWRAYKSHLGPVLDAFPPET